MPAESPIADRVRQILDLEVDRILERAQAGPISEEDAKRLETLVRTDKLMRESEAKAPKEPKRPSTQPIGKNREKLVGELADANTEE